ncbi:MAG: preprotein translocase subunit SecG [Pseudomonadota bacterium]
MIAIILTIHTMIVLALVGVVLLQRSEGGALGMGGGGGGLMSGRGAATALTRTTTILASLFFLSSISLAFVSKRDSNGPSILPTDLETDPTSVEGDFSDIIGTDDETGIDGETAPEDAFTLPDDLGLEDEDEEQPEQ